MGEPLAVTIPNRSSEVLRRPGSDEASGIWEPTSFFIYSQNDPTHSFFYGTCTWIGSVLQDALVFRILTSVGRTINPTFWASRGRRLDSFDVFTAGYYDHKNRTDKNKTGSTQLNTACWPFGRRASLVRFEAISLRGREQGTHA